MKYQDIKNELSALVSSTRYFSRKWFDLWLSCYRKRLDNIEKGIDDSYYQDNVLLFHSWDDIYKSRFYRDNSSAYCEFLSVVNGRV